MKPFEVHSPKFFQVPGQGYKIGSTSKVGEFLTKEDAWDFISRLYVNGFDLYLVKHPNGNWDMSPPKVD